MIASPIQYIFYYLMKELFNFVK